MLWSFPIWGTFVKQCAMTLKTDLVPCVINDLPLLKASDTGYLYIGYLKMTIKCIAVFATCI